MPKLDLVARAVPDHFPAAGIGFTGQALVLYDQGVQTAWVFSRDKIADSFRRAHAAKTAELSRPTRATVPEGGELRGGAGR